jgi:polyhydroxyalkanoate synthase subunit PhaC
MTDPTPGAAPDPSRLAAEIAALAAKSQRVIQSFLDKQAQNGGAPESLDPLNIGSAFLDLTTRMMADPAKLIEAQTAFWQAQQQLWFNTLRRAAGESVEPMAVPDKGDRRFKDAQWDEHLVFDYLKQSYLLSARWLRGTVAEANNGSTDPEDAKKVDFYTRQFIDALSPSNFALTNPEVLRVTAETHGENLLKGLSNLLDDLQPAMAGCRSA